MNENAQSAAVKAAEFTPAEVSAWLRAEVAKLDSTGMRGLRMSISASESDPVTVCADPIDRWEYKVKCGATIAEAYAELRAAIPTGADLIQTKLEAIAKLNEEIRALAGPKEEVVE